MSQLNLFTGASPLLTMPSRVSASDDAAMLGIIDDGSFIVDDAGQIVWIGRRGEHPPELEPAGRTDLGGRLVLPGFVEAHTHLIFAGERTHDYALRCAGASYEEVAERGGGIRLTVRSTRSASREALMLSGRERLNDFLRHGVTTVEIKSGYGLDLASELKCLEIAQALGEAGPTRIVATCLAAHIVPDAFKDRRDDYIGMVTQELLPEVARRDLARFVDVFCEVGAYRIDETERIFDRARALGLGIKVHAEQLSYSGAARLAASYGATSADHLEHIKPEDAAFLAESGTAAVLLPGAGLFLGGQTRPPARALLDAGVAVAISTDFNPGTCPSTHLPLMTTFGCSWLGMSTVEALRGVTVHAAHCAVIDVAAGSKSAST